MFELKPGDDIKEGSYRLACNLGTARMKMDDGKDEQ